MTAIIIALDTIALFCALMGINSTLNRIANILERLEAMVADED